ncbi:hypothetical protein KR009_010052 [Drosophila setifemur]|nr:hypothetical protein KR009_010052 [Drosophila setifemur]
MRGYNLFAILIAAIVASQLDSTLAIQCYSCTSSANDNCLNSPSSLTTVDCDTDCYTSTDGKGALTRGCLTAGTTCTGPTCNSCNTDKCNVNLVCQECLGEPDCGQTAVTGVNYNAVCLNDQFCVNQVNANNTVSRSCGKACDTGVSADTCSSCQTALCNQGFYPASRLQCYKCTGDACNNVADNMIVGCGLTAGEKCFTSGTSATNLTRGCTSDTTNAKCPADSTDASCRICDSAKCNSLTYDVLDEFTCFACISSQTPACWAGGADATYPKVACSNKTCFSGYWNGQMVRDCFSSASSLMQYQCDNNVKGHQCNKCTTANCNFVAYDGASALSQVGVVGLILASIVAMRPSF